MAKLRLGMDLVRTFPPLPCNGASNERKNNSRAFIAMNGIVEDKGVIGRGQAIAGQRSPFSVTRGRMYMTPCSTGLPNVSTGSGRHTVERFVRGKE